MTLRSSGRKASATGRKTGGEKPKSRSGDRRSRDTQEGGRTAALRIEAPASRPGATPTGGNPGAGRDAGAAGKECPNRIGIGW